MERWEDGVLGHGRVHNTENQGFYGKRGGILGSGQLGWCRSVGKWLGAWRGEIMKELL